MVCLHVVSLRVYLTYTWNINMGFGWKKRAGEVLSFAQKHAAPHIEHHARKRAHSYIDAAANYASQKAGQHLGEQGQGIANQLISRAQSHAHQKVADTNFEY